MGAKNPQFAGKIVINEQVGNGIFFSEDLESPILGVVENEGQEGLYLDVDAADVINLSFETLAAFGDAEDSTGAGALDPTVYISEITTTGADALTLADGEPGVFKMIYMVVDGGDGTLTPDNPIGFSTITFDDVGDSAYLYMTSAGWIVLSATATVA